MAFGNVLNVSAALGISLFLPDDVELRRMSRTQIEIVRLIPSRVMPTKAPTDGLQSARAPSERSSVGPEAACRRTPAGSDSSAARVLSAHRT